jgi:hypothetical protein
MGAALDSSWLPQSLHVFGGMTSQSGIACMSARPLYAAAGASVALAQRWEAQVMQRVATGRAARRAAPISWPHLSQMP